MQAVPVLPCTMPPINPKIENEAHELYARFQSLVAENLGNDRLAEAICSAVNGVRKSQIYTIKACKFPIPYKLMSVLDALNMGLPDVVSHVFVKRATYITLIFQKTFKLYLRQRISAQNTIYEVGLNSLTKLNDDPEPEVKDKINSTDIPNDSFIIFISNTKTYKFPKPIDSPFYFRRPPLTASMYLREAPFHHEFQRDNLCGMHSVNAFVGYCYFNEQTFMEYKDHWSNYCDVPKSTEKQEGVDPTFLKFILDKIVSTRTEYEVICIDTDKDSRQSLLQELQPIDRMIVGGAGAGSGHCSTFRKDCDNVWWRVDSERDEQDSFENDSDLIEELLEDAATNQLYLLLPRGEKEVRFKEIPPTV